MTKIKKLGRIFKPPYILWWLPVIVMIVFFYPVLFGDKLFFGVDHGRDEDLPLHVWFGEALKQGTWRINPLYFGGFPTYLSQMDFFHPISFLFYKFISPISAYHWIITLIFVGQWYGFYLLSRKLKISLISSIFASFVWIFSQWNVEYGSLESIGISLVWVPFLFFLAIKISENRHKLWYALLAALILAPIWVFGLTQLTLYLATATVIFAMFLDFRSKRFDFLRYKTTFICIAVILLSVAFVLPIIKADYAIHRLGWRAEGLSYQRSGNEYYNIFDLVHFISPFIVLPFINTEYTQFYFGILPLLLVILTWKIRDWNPYIKFFQWMAILTLIIAIKYSPLFYVLTKIPIFNFFRGSGKFLFLTNFSLAILGGFGLDMLKEGRVFEFFAKISHLYKKFLIIFISIIVGINALYYFAFDALSKIGFKVFMRFGYAHTLQREPLYYVDKVRELLESWFYQFSFSNIEIWLAIITLISTGLVIALLLKNKVSIASFSILAIILVCLSSFFIWHRYYRFVSASVLKPTPVIEFLMSHGDNQYRTLTFNLGIESYKKLGLEYKNPEKLYKFEVATLISGAFMHYNIETLNGHEAFWTKRQQFISAFNGQFATQAMTLDEKRKLFESKIGLISMMNAKYILSSLPLSKPFIKRLDSNITDTQIPLYVYENPNVLPKVYFAESTLYLEENLPDNVIEQKLSEIKDFKKQTLIECKSCGNGLQTTKGIVRLESYRPDETVLNVENKNDSWLVFSWSFLPGWRAFVDGEETKIYRANYLFQAIKVPAGNHKVLFRYKIL